MPSAPSTEQEHDFHSPILLWLSVKREIPIQKGRLLRLDQPTMQHPFLNSLLVPGGEKRKIKKRKHIIENYFIKFRIGPGKGILFFIHCRVATEFIK